MILYFYSSLYLEKKPADESTKEATNDNSNQAPKKRGKIALNFEK
jgi:hypothetical protein